MQMGLQRGLEMEQAESKPPGIEPLRLGRWEIANRICDFQIGRIRRRGSSDRRTPGDTDLTFVLAKMKKQTQGTKLQ